MARYALIVGIAQYDAKGLAQLEKTTTDAEAVAQVLEQYGNFTEVKRLPSRINSETKKRAMVNQPVTANELWQAIETLLNEQARNNEALIYFTGHGLKAEGRSGKPRGYLATSDCQIKADVIKSEGNKDEPRITEVQGGVAFDDLNDLISKSELTSLVILLDCCHSGNFIESNLIKHSFGISLEKDYYLIAACRGFQTGKALKSEAHSVFTGALLRGLRAENASSDGEISCDRLYDYISRQLRGASQQPLKLGWGTSIILVNNPLAIAPPVVEVLAAQAVVNRENPYLGLMAFDADKKDYFFGRKSAARGIGERLSKSRFLAVIGPSGCGKSSLVKAGVLPELKRDLIPDSSQWEVKIFTPGRYPLEELEQALANREPDQTFLLFIDQFEELFTLVSDEFQQREFISKITEEATQTDGDTRVIVAIRGDFLDRCAGYEETANLINCTQPTTYLVTPMTTAELTEAIEQPAEKHAITFESGLVEQIIIDVVNQAGALPLLQYALAELWRVCITDSNHSQPQLTFNGYEQIRGVKGALEKRADELYQNLAEADQKFVRCLFLELVQLGENQEVTRRHASWQDLRDKAESQEQLERVTRQLANWNQRLIITDENKVEVAHEALLSEWRRLRKWIEDNRDNIRLERRLEGDCQEWNKQNRLEGLLLTGTWLAVIDEWVKKDGAKLSPLESEFLEKSLKKRDRQKFLFAAPIFLVALLFAFLAVFQIQAKTNEARLAQKGKIEILIATAKTFWSEHKQIEALRESVKALNDLNKADIKQTEESEYLKQITEIVYKVQERNRLEGHTKEVSALSFSHDGKFIASGSQDKTIKIWSVEEGRSIVTIPAHIEAIWAVKFSHKGNMIASSSLDKNVKIWRTNGQPLHLRYPMKHSENVYGISFSPDDKILASSGRDGKIKLWNTDNGRFLKEFEDKHITGEQKYWIFSVDFNPKILDGSMMVSAGYSTPGTADSRLRLWDLKGDRRTSEIIGTPQDYHTAGVYIVRFSPQGNIIASGGLDNNVKLWDVERKKLIATLVGHKQTVFGLSFSSDGSKLASASEDETIKIWDVDQIEKKWKSNHPSFSAMKIEKSDTTLEGHSKTVRWVEFQPSKNSTSPQIIASASNDRTIRLWQVNLKENNLKLNQLNDLDKTLSYACTFLKDYYNTHKNLATEKHNFCPMLILK